MLAKAAHDWRFVTPVPPREVFATMEQLIGTRPYRFEVVSDTEAMAVEHLRRGFFGNWATPRLGIRWIRCTAVRTPVGTRVSVIASSGGGLIAKAVGRADKGPVSRGLQVVKLLAGGRRDGRTIYRERLIPPGPVTLVASWAGMRYPLYSEPSYDAPRAAEVLTATEMQAIPGGDATFVHVRLAGGGEGYIERDQIVAATEVATRDAQTEVAQLV